MKVKSKYGSYLRCWSGKGKEVWKEGVTSVSLVVWTPDRRGARVMQASLFA